MQAMSHLLCATFYGQEEHKWSRLTANKSPPQQQKQSLLTMIWPEKSSSHSQWKGFDESPWSMVETPWKAEGAKQ